MSCQSAAALTTGDEPAPRRTGWGNSTTRGGVSVGLFENDPSRRLGAPEYVTHGIYDILTPLLRLAEPGSAPKVSRASSLAGGFRHRGGCANCHGPRYHQATPRLRTRGAGGDHALLGASSRVDSEASSSPRRSSPAGWRPVTQVMSRRSMTSCTAMSSCMLHGGSRVKTSNPRSRYGAMPWQPCPTFATRCKRSWSTVTWGATLAVTNHGPVPSGSVGDPHSHTGPL